MARADYDALTETAYLLRAPENARRLLESLKQAHEGERAALLVRLRLVFTRHTWEDYRHWQQTDRSTLRRVNRLIEATLREPTSGIGKAEQLRHILQGCWSRRIDEEHRLVYLIDNDDLVILQARYHYEP